MYKLVIIAAMVAATVTIVWSHSPVQVQATATAAPILIHKIMESNDKPLPVENWSPAS